MEKTVTLTERETLALCQMASTWVSNNAEWVFQYGDREQMNVVKAACEKIRTAGISDDNLSQNIDEATGENE